jgi:hypothetical protein
MAVQQETDFIPSSDEFATENIQSDIEDRPASSLPPIKSGWAAAAEIDAPKQFTKDLVVSEEPQLVKFLDPDGPYATYKAHWLDEKKEGQKSFVCLEKGCPICLKLPDNYPSKRRAFSVAVISPDGTATLTRLNAAPTLFKQLHAAESSLAGPLSKNYWSLSRRGAMQAVVFTVTPVKGRDLMEDYGIDEAKVDAQIAEMTPFDPSDIRRLSVDELTEIVNALI